MEIRIIEILGENNTTPAVFTGDIEEVSAVYTYEGEVFCLHDGMDFPLEDLSEFVQEQILEALENNEYRFDDTFQG